MYEETINNFPSSQAITRLCRLVLQVVIHNTGSIVHIWSIGHTYKISELRKRLMVRYEEAINNFPSFSANSSAGTL